ncbi:hypothetical protein HAX54_021073, partial [Datura stramonium]|nr:hypothetical protein [Datura stramonium]
NSDREDWCFPTWVARFPILSGTGSLKKWRESEILWRSGCKAPEIMVGHFPAGSSR